MKILRVVHGLANNICDIEIPEDFNMAQWTNNVRAVNGIHAAANGLPLWINLQWVQHVVVMTVEAASDFHRQGMTAQ
jgi:hypothetical protein